MKIREATEKDIPEILEVLKASLGEISSKKTEAVWRYKHIENPFGKSLVLLAIEGDKIIGIRAFMRWKWQKGEKVFCGFRAVDTATHPEHQGKGIFKKLTLEALRLGEEMGDHFVFNTPNENSKPGYLKMGWQEIGKLSVSLCLANPFKNKKTSNLSKAQDKTSDNLLKPLMQEINLQNIFTNKLFTPKSTNYLNWRYESNPLQQYLFKATEKYYLAAYVKSHGKIKELRIVEAIVSDQQDLKLVNKQINAWTKEMGTPIISSSPNFSLNRRLTFSGRFGPVLTFKKISLPKDFQNEFSQMDTWKYTLGDLELF